MQLKDLTPRYAALAGAIEAKLGAKVERLPTTTGELGFRVGPDDLLEVCRALRDTPELKLDAAAGQGGRVSVTLSQVQPGGLFALDVPVVIQTDQGVETKTISMAADKARVDADDAKDRRLSRELGIDGVLKQYKLDAFITPGGSGAGIAARAAYPIIAVPFATVPNNAPPAFSPGFDPKPAPFGVTFTGMACSEPKLIALAYAFEQATKKRMPPSQFP